MMDLVTDIEQTSNAWAVGRFDLIASQAKLPDEIAGKIPPVKWLAIAGHVNGGVSAQLRAEANDDQAAENLRGVLNGVISLAKLQGQNDPKLTSLVNSLQLSGNGKTVRLSFALPAELFELMQPKAHAVPLSRVRDARRFAPFGRRPADHQPAVFFFGQILRLFPSSVDSSPARLRLPPSPEPRTPNPELRTKND